MFRPRPRSTRTDTLFPSPSLVRSFHLYEVRPSEPYRCLSLMISHASLEQALGYQFRDPALLEQALTHRSHSARHNERLEFLGDSVLNFVVAALLFKRFGKIDEGDLSRVRASLVKQASLAEIGRAHV